MCAPRLGSEHSVSTLFIIPRWRGKPTFAPRLECTFLSEFAEPKSSAIGSLSFVKTLFSQRKKASSSSFVVAVVFVRRRRRRCRRRCRLRRRLVVVTTVAQIQEKVIISFQFAFLNKSFSALAELVLRVAGAHSPNWRRSFSWEVVSPR